MRFKDWIEELHISPAKLSRMTGWDYMTSWRAITYGTLTGDKHKELYIASGGIITPNSHYPVDEWAKELEKCKQH